MAKKKAKDNSPITREVLSEVLDNALDKKLEGYFREYSNTIIEAVNFGFEKNENEHKELFRRVYSLEQRVASIENIITDHGKMLREHGKMLREQRDILASHGRELKKIRELLDKIQKQKSSGDDKIILLEQRVERLEAKVL